MFTQTEIRATKFLSSGIWNEFPSPPTRRQHFSQIPSCQKSESYIS